MTRTRIAYMPLATYPEAVADGSVQAAAAFAASLGSALHVATFAVNIPRMSSRLADLLIDIPGLVHAAEEKSKVECHRTRAPEASDPVDVPHVAEQWRGTLQPLRSGSVLLGRDAGLTGGLPTPAAGSGPKRTC